MTAAAGARDARAVRVSSPLTHTSALLLSRSLSPAAGVVCERVSCCRRASERRGKRDVKERGLLLLLLLQPLESSCWGREWHAVLSLSRVVRSQEQERRSKPSSPSVSLPPTHSRSQYTSSSLLTPDSRPLKTSSLSHPHPSLAALALLTLTHSHSLSSSSRSRGAAFFSEKQPQHPSKSLSESFPRESHANHILTITLTTTNSTITRRRRPS